MSWLTSSRIWRTLRPPIRPSTGPSLTRSKVSLGPWPMWSVQRNFWAEWQSCLDENWMTHLLSKSCKRLPPLILDNNNNKSTKALSVHLEQTIRFSWLSKWLSFCYFFVIVISPTWSFWNSVDPGTCQCVLIMVGRIEILACGICTTSRYLSWRTEHKTKLVTVIGLCEFGQTLRWWTVWPDG